MHLSKPFDSQGAAVLLGLLSPQRVPSSLAAVVHTLCGCVLFHQLCLRKCQKVSIWYGQPVQVIPRLTPRLASAFRLPGRTPMSFWQG